MVLGRRRCGAPDCKGVAVVVVMLSMPAMGIGPDDLGGSFVDDDTSVHEGAIEAIALEGITRGCNPPGTGSAPTLP